MSVPAMAANGHIQVISPEGVDVFMDDDHLGVTSAEAGGMLIPDVPSGKHLISFFLNGMEPVTMQVIVPPGDVVVVRYEPVEQVRRAVHFSDWEWSEDPDSVGAIICQSLPVQCSVGLLEYDIQEEKRVDRFAFRDIDPGRYTVMYNFGGDDQQRVVNVDAGAVVSVFYNSVDDSFTVSSTGITKVMLETNAGDILIEVHPNWAPVGALHFLELVNAGYYNGAPFFRVIDGFVAQCGFSGSDELTVEWGDLTIADDPVVMGNFQGTLAFGQTGNPESRSTHFFINFVDNNRLDTSPNPFPVFAKVIEGVDVLDRIYRTGENPEGTQDMMGQPGGVAEFIKMNPEVTIIRAAYVVE